jgi:hypothetical protein
LSGWGEHSLQDFSMLRHCGNKLNSCSIAMLTSTLCRMCEMHAWQRQSQL